MVLDERTGFLIERVWQRQSRPWAEAERRSGAPVERDRERVVGKNRRAVRGQNGRQSRFADSPGGGQYNQFAIDRHRSGMKQEVVGTGFAVGAGKLDEEGTCGVRVVAITLRLLEPIGFNDVFVVVAGDAHGRLLVRRTGPWCNRPTAGQPAHAIYEIAIDVEFDGSIDSIDAIQR